MKKYWLIAPLAAVLLLVGFSSCRSETGSTGDVAPSDGVRVAAWNMKWFPSGRPILEDKDRKPEQELKRIAKAADFINWQRADIVMLEEIRDLESATMLATNEALRGSWRVNTISEFSVNAGATIPPHQNAIISRFEAVDAGWRVWRGADGIYPPRGFVFAVFDIGGHLTAVVGVHLKSNFIPQDAEDPEKLPPLNRKMREISARELVEFAAEISKKSYGGRHVENVIVGGDFNTSIFDKAYDGEQTVPTMLAAGFADCFDGVAERNTMPESKWYPATCFDYIFARGKAEFFAPVVAPKSWTSDHQMISVIIRTDGRGAGE